MNPTFCLLVVNLLQIFQPVDTVQPSYGAAQGHTVTYQMVLQSAKLKLTNEVFFSVDSNKNGTLTVGTVLHKLIWEDGSDMEKEINRGYQSYTGLPYQFRMDTLGKMKQGLVRKDNGEDASQVFDVKLYFVDFPATGAVPGQKWESRRVIRDIVFSGIRSIYSLVEVTDTTLLLQVKNIYTEDSKKFTKELNGRYVIDRQTGLLISGNLDMKGFSGFSNISGNISIKRIEN